MKKPKVRKVEAWAIICLATGKPHVEVTWTDNLEIHEEKPNLSNNGIYEVVPCTITYTLPPKRGRKK